MALIQCYNKGCGQMFDPDKNNEDSCQFHPGIPVFHDALKGWSCCKKRSTDFTEFLNMPGCVKGQHSNEKPPEPEKPEPQNDDKDVVVPVTIPQPIKPVELIERPSVDETMVTLPHTVAPSLIQALERKIEQLKLEHNEDGDHESKFVAMGTRCNNSGCKKCYEGEQSNDEECVSHSGAPIFHEGMKYWSCCKRKTTEFTSFLDQEGCCRGKHLWKKKQESSSCRFDWHQTNSQVVIAFYSKIIVPEETYVKANRVSCKVNILFEAGKNLFEKDIVLYGVIDPTQSQVKMLGTKMELILRKEEAFSWRTLELPPMKQN